ncbi:MAG: response regulator, partial [Kangiellaceae bacterium]|nr:response regulator [Kangiellaceae bacterium]
MSQPLALIIDDEPDILELLSITLMRMGIDCKTAATVTQAKDVFSQNSFDLVLTDMRLPDGTGLEIVKHIQQVSASTPVAVITAHGNMQTAIESMKLGAFDFLSKPVDLANLRSLVDSALRLR